MKKWEISTNKINNTKINKNNGMMKNKQRNLNDYHLIHEFMIYIS